MTSWPFHQHYIKIHLHIDPIPPSTFETPESTPVFDSRELRVEIQLYGGKKITLFYEELIVFVLFVAEGWHVLRDSLRDISWRGLIMVIVNTLWIGLIFIVKVIIGRRWIKGRCRLALVLSYVATRF